MKKALFCVPLLFVASLFAQESERFVRAAKPVKGEYIVILDRAIPASAIAGTAEKLAVRHNGRVRRIMTSAANGFSVDMTEAQARALSRNPNVLVVEENGEFEISPSVATSNWHLDRIDQPAGTNGRYSYCETGQGVTVYVVDTGVAKLHSEFLKADGTSRILDGVNFSNDTYSSVNPCGGFTGDEEDVVRTYNGGHGTSVASLIAGKTVGVAKGAEVVSVKIANCPPPDHGSNENIVITTEHVCWAVDWIRSLSNPYRAL